MVQGLTRGEDPWACRRSGRLATCPHGPVRVLARVPLSNPGAAVYLRGVRRMMSGGEAGLLLGSWARPAGWPYSRGLTCRVRAEQGLAVAAAEQEDEPFQVITQLGQAVGGVADELCQGLAQAGGGRGPAIG
jgi:hypothetical protein